MSINEEPQPAIYFYTVQIKEFVERHFIKNFRKKYNTAWDITYRAIESMLGRVDTLVSQTSKAEIISTNEKYKLVKVYFSVAGTRQSAKSSGNRLIVLVNEETKICSILLAYSKNDIPTQNETQAWKKIIKENYPELRPIFRL